MFTPDARVTPRRILAVDAETNGLYGAPFAIAAVARGGGAAPAVFLGRCPLIGPVDPWVDREVIPVMTDIPCTHDGLDALLDDFWLFYRAEVGAAGDEDLVCIAHCAAPVEAGLFRRCVERDPATREFQAPFPLHDLATLLLAAGEDPRAARSYLQKAGLKLPVEDHPHDPLADAWCCLIAAESLLSEARAGAVSA